MPRSGEQQGVYGVAREDGRERPDAREDGRERPDAREDRRQRPDALDAKCRLICIDPAQVHQFWPHVAPLIQAAMERGRISEFAPVAEAVHSGSALVWIAWDEKQIKAAAVTRLGSVNGERSCTIVACASGRLRPSSRAMGRDRRAWLPLLAGLERYARAEGCKAMRIFGRRGWGRLLPDYRPARVLLEKELT